MSTTKEEQRLGGRGIPIRPTREAAAELYPASGASPPPLLYGITWLTDFSAALLVFSVTRNLSERVADPIQLGLAGGGLCAAHTVSTLVCGHLSDRLGRRAMTAGGMLVLLASIGAVALLQADHWSYFFSYACAGAATGAIYPSLIAWLTRGEHGPHTGRVLVGFCLAWNVGMMAGQAVGGKLFGRWGTEAPLILAMILLSINVVATLLADRNGLPDSTTAGREQSKLPPKAALSAAFARLGWIGNVGGTFSMSMVLFLFPHLAVGLSIAPAEQGGMVAMSRIVVISTYLVMYLTQFWHHRFSVALVAQSLGIVGLVCLSLAESRLGLMLGLAAFSTLPGYNYFASLFYSTCGSTDEARGASSGIHEATLGAGLALGSVCGGLIGSYGGDRAPFWLAAAVIAALSVTQVLAFRKLIVPIRARMNALTGLG